MISLLTPARMAAEPYRQPPADTSTSAVTRDEITTLFALELGR